MVADWVQCGTWDISRLVNIVNSEVIQSLIAILPPMEAAGADIIVWNGNSHDRFTVKSAYFMIEQPPPQVFSSMYKRIWSWQGAERIRIFLWP